MSVNCYGFTQILSEIHMVKIVDMIKIWKTMSLLLLFFFKYKVFSPQWVVDLCCYFKIG